MVILKHDLKGENGPLCFDQSTLTTKSRFGKLTEDESNESFSALSRFDMCYFSDRMLPKFLHQQDRSQENSRYGVPLGH